MNKSRLYFFYGVLIIGFMILIARLFELQIIVGAQNRAIAEGNRIRKVIIPAPRGIIYDRENRPLVKNVPLYRLQKDDCSQPAENCFEDISREKALEMEAKGGREVGKLRVDIGRDYVYGSALVHILGYLSEASKEEVKAGKYGLGDLLGRMGVEEKYDQVLRGQDGGEVFEVDHQEKKIRMIGKIEPVPGRDVYLSIDSELNKAAYDALAGEPGAVIVSQVKTGLILALISSPVFNPDKITEETLADLSLPFFNRAIGGVYPPGSTFKIVTAAAGVEEGKVDKDTFYEDTGQITIGEYTYKNWYFTQYGKAEGEIGLVRAIKRSTDTFFYKVGEWVGATKLSEWAKAFGLGRLTDIDLPGEAGGLVPDPEWKEKVKGERWFLGNTYHLAIGQADLLTTPLQINMMTSVIANDGWLCRPRVTKDTSDGGREVNLLRGGGERCQDLHLQAETLRLIREGMKEACSPGGTAFPFFDFSPQVACKTGTAEYGNPEGKTHAWLTAFAPAEEPEIVVTVLVEGGGEGSYAAAPVAKKVMEEWFAK